MGNLCVLQFMILISGRQDMDKIPRRRKLTAGVFGSGGFAAATLAGLVAISELAMSAPPPATAQWWRQ